MFGLVSYVCHLHEKSMLGVGAGPRMRRLVEYTHTQTQPTVWSKSQLFPAEHSQLTD